MRNVLFVFLFPYYAHSAQITYLGYLVCNEFDAQTYIRNTLGFIGNEYFMISKYGTHTGRRDFTE